MWRGYGEEERMWVWQDEICHIARSKKHNCMIDSGRRGPSVVGVTTSIISRHYIHLIYSEKDLGNRPPVFDSSYTFAANRILFIQWSNP